MRRKGSVQMSRRDAIEVTPDGCWLYHLKTGDRGYKRVSVAGKNYSVHRFSWALAHGEYPPRSIDIHHQCGNKACFNPNHLEALTKDEHALEHPPVDRLPKPKLNPDAVREIRNLKAAGVRQSDIARRFKVSRVTVHDVVHGHKWGWVQ